MSATATTRPLGQTCLEHCTSNSRTIPSTQGSRQHLAEFLEHRRPLPSTCLAGFPTARAPATRPRRRPRPCSRARAFAPSSSAPPHGVARPATTRSSLPAIGNLSNTDMATAMATACPNHPSADGPFLNLTRSLPPCRPRCWNLYSTTSSSYTLERGAGPKAAQRAACATSAASASPRASGASSPKPLCKHYCEPNGPLPGMVS